MTVSTLDEIVSVALSLSPKERLQLIERLASSLEREIEEPAAPQEDEHWGRNLVQLVNSLDMSDWEAMDIDDPVEWLQNLRAEEQRKRLGDWGAE